jgi:hypothetical protein
LSPCPDRDRERSTKEPGIVSARDGGTCRPHPQRNPSDMQGSERDGRLRTLGDCLDSFEGAEHVAPVATLPQEPAERAPNLGEEVVAEVE